MRRGEGGPERKTERQTGIKRERTKREVLGGRERKIERDKQAERQSGTEIERQR